MSNHHNLFGWLFEPWEPEPELPPEGERWTWHHIEFPDQIRVAVRRKDELYAPECHWIPIKRGLAREWEPLHPYINPSDPPTLAEMPERELCVTNAGWRARRGGYAYRWTELINLELAENLQVFARPHARERLKADWPRRVDELPEGVFGVALGVPVDCDVCLPGEVPVKDMVTYRTPIDTDDQGRPKILGRLERED